MTPNKGSGPQFWDTVYISEVNGAKKVTPDALVAMNKNDVVVNFKKRHVRIYHLLMSFL